MAMCGHLFFILITYPDADLAFGSQKLIFAESMAELVKLLTER
jgi:hypothetical protein